jgi:hypothetical protein
MRKTIAVALVLLAPSAAAGGPGGVYVETGVEAGGAVGVEGRSHSSWRAVSEIGYMWERYATGDATGWGGGATFYAALGDEDMRLGLKPRLRYRFRPEWFVDVSAGVIFATLENEPDVSDTGFVGGVSVGYGTWLTLRTDVNVKRVEEWTTFHHNQPVVHEGGYETAIYAGIALRNRPGWMAMAVGTAVVLGLMVVVIVSGGAS